MLSFVFFSCSQSVKESNTAADSSQVSGKDTETAVKIPGGPDTLDKITPEYAALVAKNAYF